MNGAARSAGRWASKALYMSVRRRCCQQLANGARPAKSYSCGDELGNGVEGIRIHQIPGLSGGASKQSQSSHQPVLFWTIKQSAAIKKPGQANKYETTTAVRWGDEAEERAWWASGAVIHQLHKIGHLSFKWLRLMAHYRQSHLAGIIG